MYTGGYKKPAIEAASDKAIEIVAKHGINGHAAALRWTVYHSTLDAKFGDAIIIAASSIDQLNSNLDFIEQGPLPEEVVNALGDLYTQIAGEEMPYHF